MSPTFARFWKCALQVNPSSYAERLRGQGHGMNRDEYAQALVSRCRELDIKVVGLADHGNVDEVESLASVLGSAGVVVFPGFEIASTEKVHMVCLYREGTARSQLDRILGELRLRDPQDGVRPSNLGCLDLARLVEDQGGFWYAAHATSKNGLLKLQGDGGGLTHVWRESRLVRVAQIPGGIEDLPLNYRRIVDGTDPNYRRDRPIVLINAKDVARPEDLGEPGATTFVKMTNPGFDAFKVAFLDPESRIRLHRPEVGLQPSLIESVEVIGGYLDAVRVELSAHLNTIIGGRGTGKSTLIECIRFALQRKPKGKAAQRLHDDIISENLGKSSGTVCVRIRSCALHGARFTISRRFGEPAKVFDAEGNTSRQTPDDLLPDIEIYGQNEIYEMAQAGERARLLDRFLSIEEDASRQQLTVQQALAGNRVRLEKALNELGVAKEQVHRLPKLREQLSGFEKLGVEAKLAAFSLFERERQLVKQMGTEVDRVGEGLAALRDSLPDLTFVSETAFQGLPHAERLRAMRGELERLLAKATAAADQLDGAIRASLSALIPLRSAWEEELSESEHQIESVIASLPDMAGKSGREVGAAYRQLTHEVERVRPHEAKVRTLEQLTESLRAERRALLNELMEFRGQRSTELQRMVLRLNKRLDGKIRVVVKSEHNREPLKKFLLDSQIEGVRDRRLAWLDEHQQLTPQELAAAIREGAPALQQRYGLSQMVAEALARLAPSRLLQMEELDLDHEVDIELNVSHSSDKASFRPLARLSTGQQATAVLHLLLLDNRDPLIIDQPEDNLDNAFIADRIVVELRRAKTERQFLFATHNANIPVFGDAEWIGVVNADESRGRIERCDQGSIDVPRIRDQVANVLEGGKAAFIQRKEKYDY